MQKRKRNLPKSSKICYTFAIIFAASTLLLVIYPGFSDAWNRHVAKKQIVAYAKELADMPDEAAVKSIEEAKEYNDDLYKSGKNNIARYTERLSGDSKETQLEGIVTNRDLYYESLLSFSSDGIMGYISIPEIDVELPIRHYATKEVLSAGSGHLYGSSLPAGGENTHTVITGHSGLSSARLFTDLEKLKIGDCFFLTVAGNTLTYEVEEINVVLPNDLDKLGIEEGEDLVTLVTCTPYGINTHRLLVRGKRIADNVPVSEEKGGLRDRAVSIWHSYEFMLFLASVILCSAVFMLVRTWRRKP